MKTVTWTDNTAWEEVIREAEREEVLVMRGGYAVALVIPFDGDDFQCYAEERDPSLSHRSPRPAAKSKRAEPLRTMI